MIAVDWGTTSFRAYLLDARGQVLARKHAPDGILSITQGQFAPVLERHIADWLRQGERDILMSGMIGARQGWAEAPYCECPAGFEQIANRLIEVTWNGQRARITPGVCGHDSTGVRDVMRGEEMQILGCLDALPAASGLVCLPGTHSKWVRVENGAITHFATHMTGELFALLKQHSILARMMQDVPVNLGAYQDGVRRARQAGGLLHHLFGVRAQGLFGQLSDIHSASYLSGLLIGHEFAAALEDVHDDTLYLLGAPDLMHLYRCACEVFSRTAVTLDTEAAVRGLYALSRYLSRSC